MTALPGLPDLTGDTLAAGGRVFDSIVLPFGAFSVFSLAYLTTL